MKDANIELLKLLKMILNRLDELKELIDELR
jgi:hypothetical protein